MCNEKKKLKLIVKDKDVVEFMFLKLQEKLENVDGLEKKLVKKLKLKKCVTKQYKNSCTRERCCTWAVKGLKKKKIECHFIGPMRCQEFLYHQCSAVKRKYDCVRHRCCQYMRKGDFVKEISCKFTKFKVCPEIKFEKCAAKILREKCSRRECCQYVRRGEIVSKIGCKWVSQEYCAETISSKMFNG